jgi:hypothetical protein
MVDCTKYESGTEALIDLAVRNAFSCAFEAQFGQAEIAGLMMMAAVGLSMWIRTDSLIMPWVVFMLTGSFILPLVTTPAIALAMLVIAGVGAAAPIALARRLEVRG